MKCQSIGLMNTAIITIIIRCLTFAPATKSIANKMGIISSTVPRSGSSRIKTIGKSVNAKGPISAVKLRELLRYLRYQARARMYAGLQISDGCRRGRS